MRDRPSSPDVLDEFLFELSTKWDHGFQIITPKYDGTLVTLEGTDSEHYVGNL